MYISINAVKTLFQYVSFISKETRHDIKQISD